MTAIKTDVEEVFVLVYTKVIPTKSIHLEYIRPFPKEGHSSLTYYRAHQTESLTKEIAPQKCIITQIDNNYKCFVHIIHGRSHEMTYLRVTRVIIIEVTATYNGATQNPTQVVCSMWYSVARRHSV